MTREPKNVRGQFSTTEEKAIPIVSTILMPDANVLLNVGAYRFELVAYRRRVVLTIAVDVNDGLARFQKRLLLGWRAQCAIL